MERIVPSTDYDAYFAALKDKDPQVLRSMANAVLHTLDREHLASVEMPMYEPEQLRERAERIGLILGGYLENLRSQILEEARNAKRKYVQYDLDCIHDKFTPGLRLDTNWLHDFVIDIVRGKPINVWVSGSVVDLYPVSDTQERKKYLENRWQYMPKWDDAGKDILEVVRLMQTIKDDNSNTHIYFLLSNSGLPYDSKFTDLRINLLSQILTESGIISDTSQRQVGIIRLSDYQDNASQVMEQVIQSGHGQASKSMGDIIFQPESWLGEWERLGSSYESNAAEVRGGGPILLAHSSPGLDSPLLAAVPFFESQKGSTHLTIGNMNSGSPRAVLKACNQANRDDLHSIALSPHVCGKQFRAYQIGTLIHEELQRYINASGSSISFDDFSAEDYREKTTMR